MKRSLQIFLILLLMIPAISRAEEKLTLKQCYDLALDYSDRVAISAEEINLARARFTQVLGEVLPQITYQINEFLQDPQSIGGSDPVGRTFTQLSRTTGNFNFQQVLFRGFQAFQALKIARLDQRRTVFDKQNVERLLFQDVAIAFYTIALIERDIEADKMIMKVVRDRIVELHRRVDLGKSREGELTQEQALYSLLQADLEQEQGQRAVAYEMMAFLTGRDPMSPVAWSDPVENPDQNLDFYLGQILNRPDLKSAQTSTEIAQRNIKVARGNFMPRVDLDANVYTFRPGFQSDILWDAQFIGEVPLLRYQNFGTYKAAKVEAKQSELDTENLARIAQREVKESYTRFLSTETQYRTLRKAVDLAYKNFTLQNEDFKFGRATNLDVLTAQRTWLDSLDRKNRAQVQSWLDWTQLQIASGVLP